jgi:hypothetical protein
MLLRRAYQATVDLDRGFLFTAWHLTRRPARVVDDYLDGRSVRYTDPVRYLVIIAAITTIGLLTSGFLEQQQEVYRELSAEASEGARVFLESLDLVMTRYFNLISIAAAPFMAASSYLLFRPARRTFPEHTVFNAYTYAQGSLLFTAAVLGLGWAIPLELLQIPLISCWVAYWIWAAVRFFDVGTWNGIGRAVVAAWLGTALFSLAFAFVLVGYIRFTS